MLSHKEILELCELAGMKDVKVVTETILKKGLTLKSRTTIKMINISIFADRDENKYIIFNEEKSIKENEIEQIYLDLVNYVRENIGLKRCIVIGFRATGVYAAKIASQLDVEAIIFGTQNQEELSGNITNYVAENDPVGKVTDKVIFVKEKPEDQVKGKSYLERLVFDPEGNIIVGQQTDYSRFTSWFYNSIGNINHKVWEMFFQNIDQGDYLLEKDIYSVYLKASQLNANKIDEAIREVVKELKKWLEQNRNSFRREFAHQVHEEEVGDIDDIIAQVTERIMVRGAEEIRSTYTSVETILMGKQIFAVEEGFDYIEEIMVKFGEMLESLLDEEGILMKELIKNEMDDLIQIYLSFPSN